MAFFLLLAFCYKRERKKSSAALLTRDSGLSGSLLWSVIYKPDNGDPKIVPDNAYRTLPLQEKHAMSMKRSRSDGKLSQGVRVEYLEDILRNPDLILQEFQKLDEGQSSAWTIARKSVNLKKNRYGNILPYDRYRVVLNSDSNKNESDYINASYVDGYRRPKEYIITQGPMENTVGDFWRMVWQENAPVVVMVTDLVENGKVKCCKYWPEDSRDFGEIHVLLIHTDEERDFTVRTLLMRKSDEIRTHRVLQYHYSNWPDRTVPSDVHGLVRFLKRIRHDSPVMGGPVIVHCSAGSGRSGTFVAVDALCQQAVDEKRVDVFRFVNNARHQRAHLVQTLEQYTFIYQAIFEAESYEDTSIPLSKIGSYLKELTYAGPADQRAFISRQFSKLNRLQKHTDMSRCSVALSEHNIFKNRDPLTVPGDMDRISLEVYDEIRQTDYINAIYIDGYGKQGAYVVTQTPLPHTVDDFWRLVHQQRSSLIVALDGDCTDDPNFGEYYPHSGEQQYGEFLVQLVTFEEQADSTVRIMKLMHEDEQEPLRITLLQYKNWSSEMKPTSLIRLVQASDLWYRKSCGGPVTVHCMNGASRCGTFIASAIVYQQVKAEGAVDVFQIVRSIRTNRPEFISDLNQFRLLFEIAQEVAEEFLYQREEHAPAKKLSFKV